MSGEAENVTVRCQFCHTDYSRPSVGWVQRYTTADPAPPAECVVKHDGQVVHRCSRGVSELTG